MAESLRPPVLRMRRLLSATPQEVFDAWTDPVGMKEWMCPEGTRRTEIQLEPYVGGRFRIVMYGEQSEVEHTGEYREIQPPRKLVFTWRSSGTYGQETLVTVEFLPQGKQTELVLTHEWLPDAVALEKHTRGWQSIAEKLAVYLDTSSSSVSENFTF